jgi:hypothetical protein
MRSLPLVPALLLLAACGGDFDAGRFDVTGRWTGTARADTSAAAARYQFELELTQDEENVEGEGRLVVGGRTVPVTVDGEWGPVPSVDLVIRAEGFVPLVFDAQFDVDTIRGTAPDTARVLRNDPDTIFGGLTGSALNGVPLTIGRAP